MAVIRTMPAHVCFLDALAAELLRRPRDELAATRILLPSRRACLALRETFLRLADGAALLLPRLQPVAALDEDELALDPLLELELPPALPPLQRRLLLTRLVLAMRRAADREITHEQAVRLAQELGQFLDEVQTEGVDLAGLEGLAPAELAEHWQEVLVFLRLLRDEWPKVLAPTGCLDPADRRNRLLAAAAESWRRRPPPEPILAAGITGSIPAVADLLAVIARLPRGAVVLPGLDRELDQASWDNLGPSHPQWMLKRLLERLGIERSAVADWPTHGLAGGLPERTRLLAEVMRPAATSQAWQDQPPPADAALAGLELVEVKDLAAEALQLSLRIRAALEIPGKRVALVTSDRNLARRVAAELARWDIRADDSAGIPLDQSPPAGLLLLSAHALVSDLAPASLLAFLKHPLARGELPAGEFRRRVRALERMALRGPRPAPGFAGIRAVLDGRIAADERPGPMPTADLAAWIEGLEATARPFTDLLARGEAPLAELLEAHLSLAEHLTADEDGSPDELWAKEAGSALRGFVSEMRAASPSLGTIPVEAYPAILAVLMGNVAVRPWAPAHPRVAILGQLESRLIAADLVLVGGLVEGVWPRRPEAGPWLNRAMRKGLGLPPVEQEIGIAAHDFAMAAAAPEVVLARAAGDETGAPTTPSRWLARLSAVLEVTGCLDRVRARGQWQEWTASLDAPAEVRPSTAPAPRPPAGRRPRNLSVTEVERLMRNPYGLYANRVLGLAALEPVDADPNLAERGLIIHAILDRFVRATADGLSADPLALLLDLGRETFAARSHRPQVRTVWWPRFLIIAAWFIGIEHERRARAHRILTERRGDLDLGNGFRLRARADRIEIGADGSVAILDYKTGSLPDAKYVERGFSPQMALEGLIVAGGGFDGVPAITPSELLYIQLKGGESAGIKREATTRMATEEVIAQAREGVARLLAHFARAEIPYHAVPRPEVAPTYDEFEHLARIAEWRYGEGER